MALQQIDRARAAPLLMRATDLPPEFVIHPCLADRYVRISIAGLWDLAMVGRYRADLRQQTIGMVKRGGYRGALLDASDYSIQPAEIATQHVGAMTIARQMFGVRAAVLMRGERPKIQMARITRDTGHRMFDREADALDWLLG